MTTAITSTAITAEPAPARGAGAGGELVRVRCGAFGLLVPLAAIERVLPAALPARPPFAGEAAHPVLSLGGALHPVLFGAALLGEREVRLRPEHQLLLLAASGRRALLWVDAVEDVEPLRPLPPPPGARGALVAGWSGDGAPLAVLDAAAAVALACHGSGERRELA